MKEHAQNSGIYSSVTVDHVMGVERCISRISILPML